MQNSVAFNKEKFWKKFGEYLFDNRYYTYHDLYRIVDNELKRDGMRSLYIHLIEPLKQINKYLYYLFKINFYTNNIDKINEIEVLNDYICENYSKKMKEPGFAKNVYDFTKETYPNDYEHFVRLRKDFKDAYSEKSEVTNV